MSICQDHLCFFSLHVFFLSSQKCDKMHRPLPQAAQRPNLSAASRILSICYSSYHQRTAAPPPLSKCSSAALLPALVGLVTLQSVHAALSRNCRELHQYPLSSLHLSHSSVFHTLRLQITFLCLIKLSLRPMSRCLVNTPELPPPPLGSYIGNVCCPILWSSTGHTGIVTLLSN